MDIARLFVGLPLPEYYQSGLDGLVRSLKPAVQGSFTWARPGSWHLTLKFLGDVPTQRLPELDAALKSVSWRAFPFRAGGGGFFPSAARPRVLWVGVASGAGRCRELTAAIEEALFELGFEPEARSFSAHLTVARIKSSPRGADWKKTMEILLKTEWPETIMDRFVLWRSYLGGGETVRLDEPGGSPGPRHVPLGEYGATG
jgi:2'-5' RNA ligase